MIPTRVVRLLLVALSVSPAAQAFQLPARIGVPMNAIAKREPQATGGSTNTVTTTTSKTTAQTTPTTTPTPTDSTTTPTTPTTPTGTSTKGTTTTPNTTPTQTTDTTSSKPTTEDAGGDQQPTSTSEQTTVPTTSTMTTVMTITNSNGKTQLSTSEIVSTGLATISGNSSSTSGMSTSTRNTIIGVVVGVGGAIILCVVGLVAWRIRSRRRRAEENDGLIGYGGYTAGAAEKPDSLSGPVTGSQASRTPFQSTLESYHAPTQVNQSSNF